MSMGISVSGWCQGGGGGAGGDNDSAQAGSGEGSNTQSSTPMEPEQADGMLVIPGTRSGRELCNPTRGKETWGQPWGMRKRGGMGLGMGTGRHTQPIHTYLLT